VFAEMRGGMPDKAAFEAKRGELAKQVWARMKADDSATCRQCHTPGAMDLFAQSEKAAERHRAARESGRGEVIPVHPCGESVEKLLKDP